LAAAENKAVWRQPTNLIRLFGGSNHLIQRVISETISGFGAEIIISMLPEDWI